VRAKIASRFWWRGIPKTFTEPLVGKMRVINILIVVLFPAPLGPRKTEHIAAIDIDVKVIHGHNLFKFFIKIIYFNTFSKICFLRITEFNKIAVQKIRHSGVIKKSNDERQ
jgi:hypothetical protein